MSWRKINTSVSWYSSSIWNVRGAAAYVGRGAGHLVVDVVPYAIGGNARGPN